MAVRGRISELHDEITGWRRDIHQHPELGFDTFRTSEFVAAKLREFGCDEVVEGIGRTGVVGLIRGRTDSRNHVIGLRADMDALPIAETTNLPYASKTPGSMHACGHDGHTAMLLGAAKFLTETRGFDGTVALIFQPAEEFLGGAREMLRDGIIARFGIREIYGMHNAPGMPIGSFATRAGAMMASSDNFTIDIVGKGGHAAQPHQGVDPVVVGSQVVMALQTIASRNADPVKAIVVSVTSFRTDTDSHNIIAERVQLRGTMRTFDKSLRALGETRLKALTATTAQAFGATAEISWDAGYPPVVNAEAEAGFASAAAARVADAATSVAPMIMAAEDFSFMLEACPGAFVFVGNGNSAGVHNATYNFDDAAIPHGVSYWAELVESRMPI